MLYLMSSDYTKLAETGDVSSIPHLQDMFDLFNQQDLERKIAERSQAPRQA